MSDQNGIYITKKQASITAAVLLLLGLLIFIAGYFWGKQSIIDGFTQKTSQESFNDQVDYMLTMQSFAAKHGLPMDDTRDDSKQEQDVEKLLGSMPDALEETDKEPLVQCGQIGRVESVKSEISKSDGSKKVEPTKKVQLPQAQDAVSSEPRSAILAGFAKKTSALAMVQRLKKHKIDVEIKTRVSKSASGKVTKSWYQVVTKPYSSMDDLNAVITKIVSWEHIKRKDIKIV